MIFASSWVPMGNSFRRSVPRCVPVWPAGMKPRAASPRGAEHPDDEPFGHLRDGHLHRLALLNALARLGLLALGRSRVEPDAPARGVAGRDDNVDIVADLHDLVRVLDRLHREVGRVDESIDARLELDERAERLQASDLALVARADRRTSPSPRPRVDRGGLAAQPELALVVDAEDLHVDLRARLEQVGQPAPRSWLASLMWTSPSTPPASGSATNTPHATTLRTMPLCSEPGSIDVSASVRALPALFLLRASCGGTRRCRAPSSRTGSRRSRAAGHEVVEVGAVAQIDVRRRREGAEAAEVDLEPALDRPGHEPSIDSPLWSAASARARA